MGTDLGTDLGTKISEKPEVLRKIMEVGEKKNALPGIRKAF